MELTSLFVFLFFKHKWVCAARCKI